MGWAYDRGAKDGSSGAGYNLPHGVRGELLLPNGIRENEEYNKGYCYGKGQRDGIRNHYDDYLINSEQYNKGWKNGYSQYKGRQGECFVTTATFIAIGKGENCEELGIFRGFRDNWLSHQPNGKELINLYYELAPKIVVAINRHSNHEEIYLGIWQNSISKCLEFIKLKRFDEVKSIYCSSMLELFQTHCCPSLEFK